MTSILYERTMPAGSIVRIRRVTPEGSTPVRAVIEVDRRAGNPRTSGGGGNPPSLMQVEGSSEPEVVESLMPFAEEDSAVARLLTQQGAR